MAARARHPMPPEIERALDRAGVRADYDARPAYQRNDYLGWIARAATAETRDRRTRTMLDELARGGVYMGMAHAPSRRDGD